MEMDSIMTGNASAAVAASTIDAGTQPSIETAGQNIESLAKELPNQIKEGNFFNDLISGIAGADNNSGSDATDGKSKSPQPSTEPLDGTGNSSNAERLAQAMMGEARGDSGIPSTPPEKG